MTEMQAYFMSVPYRVDVASHILPQWWSESHCLISDIRTDADFLKALRKTST